MSRKATWKNPTFFHSTAIAARGFATVFRHEWKVRLAFAVLIICVSLAVWLNASYMEIMLILLAWTQVIVGEIFNTSIEKAMDYSSGHEFHPLIRLGKDYAAASVFVLTVFASVVSLVIFGIHYF